MTVGRGFSYYFEIGDEPAIRAWLTPYAREFAGSRLVLDVGCGPGTFLELLREQGVAGMGIDPDPMMVAHCQTRGLPAAVLYANDLPRLAGDFDGVHIGHVVEHLSGAQFDELMRHIVQRLAPGGQLLIRTPNWANAQVHGGGFWLDHTHQRPYPAPLLTKLLEGLGMTDVRAATEPNGWNDTVVRARKPAVAVESPPVALRWEGPLFEQHSLSLVNRELCRELLELPEVDLQIGDSTAPGESQDSERAVPSRFAALARAATNTTTKTVGGPNPVVVRHEYPPNAARPDGATWILMQPWDIGAIPTDWLALMRDQVDEVWVYTEYNRQCYIRCGAPAEKIHVIPLGVDVERFRPFARPMSLSTERSFRFLFVGGTIWRKGIDILLETYAATFSADDDVALVIKDVGVASSYRGQTAGDAIGRLQADPAAPEIVYLTDDLTDDELPGLYTACDVLVHPYRGEGFALPVAEAMACGLPPIVTGHGAVLDFCAPERALLVPAVETQTTDWEYEHEILIGDPWWGEVERASLAAAMRSAAEQPDEMRRLGARAAHWVRANLTWADSARAVTERLRSRAADGSKAPAPERPARLGGLIAYPDWNGDLANLPDVVRHAAHTADGPQRLVFLVDPTDAKLIERAAAELRRVIEVVGPPPEAEVVLFFEFESDDDLPELLREADEFVIFGRSKRQRRLTRLASQAGLTVRRAGELAAPATDSAVTNASR